MINLIIYLLTIIPLILVLVLSVFSLKKKDKEDFKLLNLFDSNGIRAISCVIIVFVHIPIQYGNKVQDLIGSFAGIGVAFFFLFSSFGCYTKYTNETHKVFFLSFWPKRLVSLFVPNLLINLLVCFYQMLNKNTSFSVNMLLNFNKYIYALLVLYIILFISFAINAIFHNKYQKPIAFFSAFLCLLFSILTFITPFKPFVIWSVESLGGAIGIILFIFKDKIEKILKSHFLLLLIITSFLSLVLGIVYVVVKNNSFAVAFLLKALMVISIIAFVIVLTVPFGFKKWPISFLAKISWCIYLTHLLVIPYLPAYISQEGPYSSGLFILLTFAITIAISTVITYVCEPINKLTSYLLSKIK